MTSRREAGKVIAAVLWDEKGVTVMNFLSRGMAVNSGCLPLSSWCHKSNVRIVVPQWQCQATHTICTLSEAIPKFGWTLLLHRPYSADLSRSICHQFVRLKDNLRGYHCMNDQKLQKIIWLCLQKKESILYQAWKLALHTSLLIKRETILKNICAFSNVTVKFCSWCLNSIK